MGGVSWSWRRGSSGSGKALILATCAALTAFTATLGGCAAVNNSIAVPAPDATACSSQRQSFYMVSNSAISNENTRDFASTAAQVVPYLGGLPGMGGNIANNISPVLGRLSAALDRDTRLIRQFSDSFDELVRCRRTEVAELRREVRLRHMTVATGRQKAQDIKDLAIADAAVARQVNQRLSARMRTYEGEVGQVDTSISAPSQQRTQQQQVKQTVQTNQRALATQANSVDVSVRDTLFNMSSLPASPVLREA